MSLISASRSVPEEWMVSAYLTCFGGQVLVGVLGQHLRQNQQVVERRPQLVAHVGQELALVLGGERKLLGLFFQRLLGLLDLAVLGFHFVLLLGQQLRLFLQLGVGLLQLLRPAPGSACSSCSVRMVAAMVFSTMPMTLRELIEERQVNVAELPERRQLDHRLDLAFEQHRQHDDAHRRRRRPGWS